MFTPRGLFKGIACPARENCRLPNCLFDHDIPATTGAAPSTSEEIKEVGGDRKRRRLDDGSKSTTQQPQPRANKPFVGLITGNSLNGVHGLPPDGEKEAPDDAPRGPKKRLQSLAREVSPPKPRKGGQHVSPLRPAQTAKITRPDEELNPRVVTANPAPHATRLSLLRLLHGEMQRLNDLAKLHKHGASRGIAVSPGGLALLALDEEEGVAKGKSAIYKSVMGHTIARFRKMDLAAWTAWRREKSSPQKTSKKPPYLAADLTPAHELLMLRRFLARLDGLDQHGYVLSAPSAEAVAAAGRAVRTADYWETCDRCGSRFQVFPSRRESDGALTGGGGCMYHWARAVRNRSTKEMTRPCCGMPNGSPGCTSHATHVFKSSDPARLAGVLQFAPTPDNPALDGRGGGRAVAVDCEMAYTTLGMELVRVSAAAWPSGETLLDALVRPVGHVLDLNTRFSGVSAEQFLSAEAYPLPPTSPLPPPPPPPAPADLTTTANRTSTGKSKSGSSDGGGAPPQQELRILPSPAAARALLCTLIGPSTPLIGHALDNDLNALRLLHPTVVDTALVYPHRAGLPYRLALRRLALDVLGRRIPAPGGGEGGAAPEGTRAAAAVGHDSVEDAVAAGELVRAAAAREWAALRAAGWRADGAGIAPPAGAGEEETEKAGRPVGKYLMPAEGWWLPAGEPAGGSGRALESEEAPESKEGTAKRPSKAV